MRFEPGKYYRHAAGQMIATLGYMETTMWGKTLVAESVDGLCPVGWDSDDYAQNWTEVSKEEWLKNFSR